MWVLSKLLDLLKPSTCKNSDLMSFSAVVTSSSLVRSLHKVGCDATWGDPAVGMSIAGGAVQQSLTLTLKEKTFSIKRTPGTDIL